MQIRMAFKHNDTYILACQNVVINIDKVFKIKRLNWKKYLQIIRMM